MQSTRVNISFMNIIILIFMNINKIKVNIEPLLEAQSLVKALSFFEM